MGWLHLVCGRDFPPSISFLALGDSYTIGQSVDSVESWPVQLVDELRGQGKQIDSIDIRATTGWTTTALLTSLRVQPIQGQFNTVSLLIGVNNFFQGRPEIMYIQEFQELLDSAVKYCTDGKQGVFVVSIPDYGYSPFGENDQVRISQLTDRYNFIGDSICSANNIEFINITDLSRGWTNDPELIAEDGLHPSGKQYSMWVKRISSEKSANISTLFKGTNEHPPLKLLTENHWKFLASATLQIYNWNGQLFFQQNVQEGEIVNFSALQAGVIQIIVKGKSYSWKSGFK